MTVKHKEPNAHVIFIHTWKGRVIESVNGLAALTSTSGTLLASALDVVVAVVGKESMTEHLYSIRWARQKKQK